MTRSRVGRGAVVATLAAALTIGGVAAPASAATKPYTPATWSNSESTRLDGPGYKLTPKLGGKTKGSPHVATPLGAVKGPKGSKAPAFSVQANAKAPAGKKATGTRYVKGSKAAALNYALHKQVARRMRCRAPRWPTSPTRTSTSPRPCARRSPSRPARTSRPRRRRS